MRRALEAGAYLAQLILPSNVQAIVMGWGVIFWNIEQVRYLGGYFWVSSRWSWVSGGQVSGHCQNPGRRVGYFYYPTHYYQAMLQFSKILPSSSSFKDIPLTALKGKDESFESSKVYYWYEEPEFLDFI